MVTSVPPMTALYRRAASISIFDRCVHGVAVRKSRAAQVVFVRRGNVVARHAGRRYVADPCTAIVAWPESSYSVDGELTAFELAPELVGPLLGHLRPGVDIEVRLQARVLLAYAGFASAMRAKADPGARDAAALVLVRAALRSAWSRTPRIAARRITTSAVAQLSAGAIVDTSIAALARGAGCSTYHLMHTFREEVGLTIRQYRNRLRVALALHHLASGCSNLA